MTFAEFEKEWFSPLPYITAQTSGSTGSPKSIRLSKRDMEASAWATLNYFGLGKGARFVCPMDFRYIGAKMMGVRALVSEGELVEISPSNTFSFSGRADLLAIVPSQVQCILDSPKTICNIRNVIIGGAPLSKEIETAILNCGLNAYKTYGMTETCSHVALARVGEDVFRALPGITFDCDNRGCLIITLPNRDMDLVKTNDIVELIDTTKFRWKGRADNVINSGGVKIIPELIETFIANKLKELKYEFKSVVVVPVPSMKWGTEAVCMIESSVKLDETTILDYLRTTSSDHKKLPKKIITVPSMPRTSNDKIARSKAAELCASLVDPI